MRIEVMDCNNPYVCLNYHTHIKTKVKFRKDKNYKRVVDRIENITIHRKSQVYEPNIKIVEDL